MIESKSAWHGTFHCFTHEFISIKYLNFEPKVQHHHALLVSGFTINWEHQVYPMSLKVWMAFFSDLRLTHHQFQADSISDHFSPQDNSNVRNCCIKLASTLPTISCLNGFTVGTEALALGLQTAVLRRSRSRANAASNEKSWNLQGFDGDLLGRSRYLWGSWKQQVVLLWYY